MEITRKSVEFTIEEVNANISNIIDSLTEIGIANTDGNRFFLQLILIMQERTSGLSEIQILENFIETLHMCQKFQAKTK